jgi:hypothetical protein
VVDHDSEAQLIDVKLYGCVLITDKDNDEMQAEIRIHAVQAEEGSIHTKLGFVACHGRAL